MGQIASVLKGNRLQNIRFRESAFLNGTDTGGDLYGRKSRFTEGISGYIGQALTNFDGSQITATAEGRRSHGRNTVGNGYRQQRAILKGSVPDHTDFRQLNGFQL